MTTLEKRTADFTGTVSHATMREFDLLNSFLPIIKEYNPLAYNGIIDELGALVDKRNAMTVTDSINTDEFLSDDSYSMWQWEEISYILNEGVWDAMNEIAPDGYYFGAHPGDGCDYGFWQCEDEGIW